MPIHPSKGGSHPNATQNLSHPSNAGGRRVDIATPLNTSGGKLGSDPGAAKISDGTGMSGIDAKTGFHGSATFKSPST